jgi:glucokinase
MAPTPGPDTSGNAVLLALDVGGTSIKGAVATPEGRLLSEHRWPTRAAGGGEAALAAVRGAVTDLQAAVPHGRRPVGLGVVVPGLVSEARGLVEEASNLGWRNLELAAALSQTTDLPLAVGHDVRSAGLAEHRWGAGRGFGDLLFVAVGTGIAAAVITAGGAVAADGYAGEIGHGGHVTGDRCTCGGHGCLETYASAAGIARQYGQLTSLASAQPVAVASAQPGEAASVRPVTVGASGPGEAAAAHAAWATAAEGRPGARAGGDSLGAAPVPAGPQPEAAGPQAEVAGPDAEAAGPQPVPSRPGGAKAVADAAAAGDPLAQAVWTRAAEGLGAMVADAVRLLGVPRVVVGGGLSESGEQLLALMRESMRRRLTVHRVPELVRAQLGARAGLYGAIFQASRAGRLHAA